jgi:hypothetical protein
MKSCLQTLGLLVITAILFQENALAGAQKPVAHASYGSKVSFRKDQAIPFPDFVLTFIGERHVSSPRFPRGFQFFDFVAKTDSEEVKVSWTSGTGVIDASNFKIGGKTYQLELRGSRAHGWLGPEELVITPTP